MLVAHSTGIVSAFQLTLLNIPTFHTTPFDHSVDLGQKTSRHVASETAFPAEIGECLGQEYHWALDTRRQCTSCKKELLLQPLSKNDVDFMNPFFTLF